MANAETPSNTRRVRKPSLAKLIRAAGRTDFTVEQAPDGTTRIIFGAGDKSDPLDHELSEWMSRHAVHT